LQSSTVDEPLTKRFDKSRRLFEHINDEDQSWKDNEIDRKQEEQKERDMQVNTNNKPTFNKPTLRPKSRLSMAVVVAQDRRSSRQEH